MSLIKSSRSQNIGTAIESASKRRSRIGLDIWAFEFVDFGGKLVGKRRNGHRSVGWKAEEADLGYSFLQTRNTGQEEQAETKLR